MKKLVATALTALAVASPFAVATSIPANATPVSQQNAVSTAQDYIEMSAFSPQGLMKQLAFEGYSSSDATFAVSQLDVDWNEQAARMAKDYLDMNSFSRSGLMKQLQFEGFTPTQAAYGASTAGL